MKRIQLAGLLPSCLLAALLIATSQPTSPAADRGPTVLMTVTPIR